MAAKKKTAATPTEDDLGGSESAGTETRQSLGGVSFNTTDARATPVVFDGKEVKTSTKTAADYYKSTNRGGRDLTDEEVVQVLTDAGVEQPKG
ncbi:MAG: hypothetical protein HKN37_16430 [Rhodothermales bacterium]|nr:hypothetical protein [Rhodothermales bacterium]